MSAAPAPHRWATIGYKTVSVHTLRRGRFVGELDVLVDAGSHSAYVTECAACGCISAYVFQRWDPEEGRKSFTAYGLDYDSLGIAHSAPRCEVLRMPSASEEPAGEELAA